MTDGTDGAIRGTVPRYVALAENGTLGARVAALSARLGHCDLCPRNCGANRHERAGVCGVAARARLSAAVAHRGEEPVISGTRGSGTLFLGGCNMRCVYCQNHQISQPAGIPVPEVSTEELADAMLRLADEGCHNVNVVSGAHCVPQVLAAIEAAALRGLRLPIVWNSNGYEKVEVLRQLEGVVDIYLPDIKYAGDGMAERLSGVKGYVGVNRDALREMDRQVGPLVVGEDGLAVRGVVVRHLVLPRNAAGSASCLLFVAEHMSPGVAVSLMAQYAPAHKAEGHPIIGRRLTVEEYERAVAALEELDIEVGWVQDLESAPEHYRPDFRKEDHPFEG